MLKNTQVDQIDGKDPAVKALTSLLSAHIKENGHHSR
jgi:hypothetical protein